ILIFDGNILGYWNGFFFLSCFYLIKEWVIFDFNEGGFFSEKYTISVLKRCILLFFFECNLLNIMAIY
ncbi:hypothetical protein ACVPRZ_24575, partial [Salmonella enterica subsp. enterica serovar Typhimurium]